MYATELELHNFKRFSETSIDLSSKITLLLGPNSSGKSSVIKALLGLKQTASPANEHEVFSAQGEYVDLGIYRDYVFEHRVEDKFKLGIKLSQDPLTSDAAGTFVEFGFGRDGTTEQARLLEVAIRISSKDALRLVKKQTRDSYLLVTSESFARIVAKDSFRASGPDQLALIDKWTRGISVRVQDRYKFSAEKGLEGKEIGRQYLQQYPIQLLTSTVNRVLRMFERDLYYLGPLRRSPSRSYSRTAHLLSVGASGEHTPSVLANLRARAGRERSKERDQTKRLEQLTSWIERIFPGRQVEAKSLEELVKLEIARDGTSREVISDVGFGFSQVLPILVQAAVMPENTTLLVEQPELHLHPQAQTRLAEVFAEASTSGRRFLVETHSEHFVRGLQLAVSNGTTSRGTAKQRLKPTDVRFIYVPKAPQSPREMPIDIWGEFTEPWPAGFFDEAYSVAMKLLQNKMAAQERLAASAERHASSDQSNS